MTANPTWHHARNCTNPGICPQHLGAWNRHVTETPSEHKPDECVFCDAIDVRPSTKREFNLIPQAPGAAVLEQTLEDRGEKYGDFSHMGAVAQNLKLSMRSGAMWKSLESYEQEALELIATKIARIVCGEPGQADSWHDIGGYARLAEDRCR